MADANIKVKLTCDADDCLIALLEAQIAVARIQLANAKVQLDAEKEKFRNLKKQLDDLEWKRLLNLDGEKVSN